MNWNPYEFNFPLKHLGLLSMPEHKVMVLVLAIEYLPNRQTVTIAEFLDWSQTTVRKWAATAEEFGLIEVTPHSNGYIEWHTYRLIEITQRQQGSEMTPISA